MKRIWQDNSKYIFITIVLLVAYVASDILTAFLFGKIIDSASRDSTFQYLNVIYLTLGVIVFSAIVYYSYYVHREKAIQRMVMDLRDKVFKNIINQNVTEYFKTDIGEKVSSLTNDIKILEDDYFKRYINIIRSGLLLVSSLVSIFLINYMMAIFLIVLSSLSLILPNIVNKRLEDKKDAFSVSQANYTARTTEYLSGFSTIQSFGIVEFIINEFKKNSKQVMDTANEYEKLSNKIDTVTLVLGSLTFMGGFLFGGFLVSKNLLTLGEMIICIQLSNNISNPIFSLINNITAVNSVKKITTRLEAIINRDFQNDRKDKNAIKLCQFEKSIKINSVDFSYNDNHIILDRVSIEFEKGKKYAIVGASGSGKSTLINLISRKIHPNSGRITLDDIELNRLDDSSILHLISYVEQEVFLFKGSLQDNICMFQDYSDDEIEKSLIKSGLGEFMTFRGSKDIDINEKGNSLSGGEKQRIAIARAIIRETPILLADEVLSNLDNQVANEVEKTLLSLEQVTVIAVTHRFITENIKKYDEIIFLKDGKVRCKGPFEKLLGESEDFKNLYEISAS